VEGHGASAKGARRLTGVQKGIIGIAVSVVILILTVAAVYKDFVKPPEIPQEPEPAPVVKVEEEPEAEPFTPPTVVQVETQVTEEGEEIQVETEVPASHKEGFYNILIVGTDDDGFRTDTIMIARMDVNDHTVAIMSIPRDTMIESNMSVPKINGAYGYAGRGEKGMENLKSHLAKLLGFQVDGYAVVNLSAFIELVDLVGGVEFNVPMRMEYEDPSQDLYIDLQPGLQLLDGEHAMQLVRFRKGYATQDLQRTQVQQEFLRALAKKCLSVVNLNKIGSMAQIFMDNVTTDLTIGNIAYFGQELLKCDFEKMYTYTLEGEAVYLDGISYYAVYLANTLEAVNGYFNPYDAQITEENVTILTPEYVEYLKSLEEEPEEEEEELPEEEFPQLELPETELPTDDWIVEDDTAELPPEEEEHFVVEPSTEITQ